MTVKVIEDKEIWDKFVDDSPYGLIFHKYEFLKILEKYSGYKLIPYATYRGEEMTCLFPLFFKRQNGLRMVFSPPPGMCIPYLGPVMSPLYDTLKQRKKESYYNAITDEILGEIQKFSPNYVFISAVPRLGDIRPFKWNGYSAGINYTYVIDLDRPLEDIWAGFDSNCKKSIKACEKHNLTMREVDDVDTFYRIMKERFAEQKMSSPIVSPQYLKDLMSAYPENVKMHFLYKDQEIACITLNCEYKGRLMFWMGEVNTLKDIAGNEYQKWECIKKAKAEGFGEVELEGASIKQLCMYKSKFNPSIEHNFLINKKDTLGNIAEWAYMNLVRKKV